MKRNSQRRRRGGGAALVLAVFLSSSAHLACGYRAIYGGGEALERLHVRLVRTLVPDAAASDEVASGVREELALAGALEPGDGWPRAEIEVLRAGESSEGIAARAGGPMARGADVGVVARAWIAREPGASPEHDTGDLRAEEAIAIDEAAGVPDPRSAQFHQADAVRAAAHRLGRKLGRKLLGYPAASEDERAP
jgi:hypothetical protein